MTESQGGGYVFAGLKKITQVFHSDGWVGCVDAQGNVLWEKTIGGSYEEHFNSIVKTSDGGYILAGYTESDDGDLSGIKNNSNGDCWFVKLDSAGTVQWQKTFSNSLLSEAHQIKQTHDGGYIVAGRIYDPGTPSSTSGLSDVLLMKLSSTGNLEWYKNFGSVAGDFGNSIDLTADGGYILGGQKGIKNNDPANPKDTLNWWILKVSDTGGIVWEKTFGEGRLSMLSRISQTQDGGYIACGTWNSTQGDSMGKVLKLDKSGNVQWSRSYFSGVRDVKQTNDFGYICSAGTINEGKSPIDSLQSYYLEKLDSNGNLSWSLSLGGSDLDILQETLPTADGGYLLAGNSRSFDGDVPGNKGGFDAWMVKLSPVTSVPDLENPDNPLAIYPNPAKETVSFSRKANVSIVNLQGQIVLEHKNADQVSLSGLRPGVYLLYFYDEQGAVLQSAKLIKQ